MNRPPGFGFLKQVGLLVMPTFANSRSASPVNGGQLETAALADPDASLKNPPERRVGMPSSGSATVTLTTMFQILTACCIFFAVLRASPLLAIVGTLIATPAIIRTAVAAELYRRHGIKFYWTNRVRCFLESTGLTVVTVALSATVFALTSLLFGLICMAASFVLGTPELANEIALVGTVGGMVWGAAGGILAFGFCVRHWQPEISKSLPNQAS